MVEIRGEYKTIIVWLVSSMFKGDAVLSIAPQDMRDPPFPAEDIRVFT